MVHFIGRDEASARELLAAQGVRFVRVDAPEHDAVLVEVLGDLTQERGRVVAEPPADAEDAATGMGAWHVNAVHEFETVVDGEGIVEFITGDGVVSAHIGPGDVMAVEGAEHRYRPLTAQAWILRFAADDLGARETGRPPGPWPIP
jgi:hypothetical protein